MKHITLMRTAIEAHSGGQSVAGKGQEFRFEMGFFILFPEEKKKK